MLQDLNESVSAELRVAAPGIIQSFDADAVTCVVQLAPRGSDGNGSVDLPVLVDIPVSFPRGGGVTLTFPISQGDECLVIYSDRCIDFWWQSGSVQETVEPRMHDVSDAFVIVGPQSQAKKIGGISTTAAQFRSDDGSTYFEIDPTTKKIKIVAPGGIDVITPVADFSEQVTIHGLLTFLGVDAGSDNSGPVT
nr:MULTISPECIES: Gp138 family membrane-puncturing spike protein [Limnobaculum]